MKAAPLRPLHPVSTSRSQTFELNLQNLHPNFIGAYRRSLYEKCSMQVWRAGIFRSFQTEMLVFCTWRGRSWRWVTQKELSPLPSHLPPPHIYPQAHGSWELLEDFILSTFCRCYWDLLAMELFNFLRVCVWYIMPWFVFIVSLSQPQNHLRRRNLNWRFA